MIEISQSLMKAFDKYRRNSYCGIRLKAIHIDQSAREEATVAMRAGQYFEYLATGQRNYYGERPEPDRLKSQAPAVAKREYEAGMRYVVDQANKGLISQDEADRRLADMYQTFLNLCPLSAPFEHARVQADKFREYATAYGWEWGPQDTGQLIRKDGLRGFADLIVTIPEGSPSWSPGWPKWSPTRNRAVIDLKFTGLIENTYGPMAWAAETLPEKHDLLMQPVHYSLITGLPFAFFLFSAKTGDMNARLIPVAITKRAYGDHIDQIARVRNLIEQADRTGTWKAMPSMGHCQDCPVKDCKVRAVIPAPEPIIKY